MPRYAFTIIALFVVVLAFIYESSGFFSVQVSPETELALHRETQRVTAGRSTDGELTIREITHAPSVPVRARYPNHLRTLRAYIAPNHIGVPALHLESARPRNSYVLEGAFSVSPNEASLTWVSTTTLMFYGRRGDGALTRFVADVHDITLVSEATSTLPPSNTRPVVDANI